LVRPEPPESLGVNEAEGRVEGRLVGKDLPNP